MNPFRYRQVGKHLFDEICENIFRAESTVLLAPRFGGSRYTLFRLRGVLEDRGIGPLVYVRLARHDEVTSEESVRELVRVAVAELDATIDTGDSSGLLVGPLGRFLAEQDRPAIIFIANVDYLPFHLSSRLLQEVRSLDQAGKAIAVLTGESSFYDLVFGPNSEFSCAHQFVLQGLDKAEFYQFAGHYLGSLQVELDDAQIYQIWELTGGNRHMLRIVLWEILEQRVRTGSRQVERKIDIRELVQKSRLPGPYGAEVFRYPARLIAHEPRCWGALQELIARRELEIRSPSGPPTPLELMGVAVRRGSALVFSCAWMADYVTEHFGARHWGDLYARNGDWARAFVHYGELEGDETVRPSTAEDRLEVELTIRSLSASLYAEIHNGSEAVQRLFARACRYILGYQEVAFWVYQQPQWRLDTPEEPPWGLRSLLKKAENFLPAIGCTSVGPLPLPDPWNRLAVAASLPGPPPCRQRALVLSNFKSETVVSRERERLTLELLQHFLVAYQHALGIELDRERLAMRETQAEVINSIFGTLGSHLLDVDDALMQAASGLRRSGYSRVLFSLVTPTQDRIQGELEDADDPRVDVARMTDWPLDDPKADLQPYVVHSRRPRVVEDAAREPLANVDMVAKAQMKALAIVPLLDREGHAIGTVHVERRDRGVPSTDEVSDLLHFGKQLAIAIQQIQRLKMLQAALDRIPEPVMIVDRSMQLRFTNAPAAALLAQKPGWYERRDLQTLSESQLGMVRRLASESLERGQRLVRQITELGSGQPYRGVALADAIMDWKERTVGAVLHLQDLSYLYSVFAAFRLIAESEDTKSALEATLRAAELLGHERGRLLLIDEDDPERLIGILTLDSGGRILSDSPTNKVLLPRRGDPEFRTWDCIENRSPMVACWNDEHDNRSQIITGFGLEATNARPPRCPHEIAKEPGDFWIDLPLLTRYSVLGKLTLSCDPHLKPEDFHLLRLLAEMAAGLLDAFIRRDRTERELDKKVLGPLAEQAMAVTAHSIATRLGSLPLLVTRYRLFERQLPGLKEVNNSFEHTVEEVLQTVRRFKERLASVHVEPVRTDLRQLVTVPLRELLSEQQWKISGSHTCLEVDVDQHLLENALLELIQNAREMIPSEEDLFVEVSLDVVHAFDGEAVQLSITDNGPGIPDNLKARVFEPFFSRRPGRRNKSSGVGLAFVQRVVKGHGGTIEVADAAGSGARFVLTLPRFT